MLSTTPIVRVALPVTAEHPLVIGTSPRMMMMMTYKMKSKAGEVRRVITKIEMLALLCAGWIVAEHIWS
jgi:hypothetical protein